MKPCGARAEINFSYFSNSEMKNSSDLRTCSSQTLFSTDFDLCPPREVSKQTSIRKSLNHFGQTKSLVEEYRRMNITEREIMISANAQNRRRGAVALTIDFICRWVCAKRGFVPPEAPVQREFR